MTPTQIETAARNRYNAASDSFFSSSEILDYMWQACVELSRDTNLIENVYLTTTVANQQEYAYPSTAIALRRVSYNGAKLQLITMREDDAITGLVQSTTDSGTPAYYFIWNRQIYLRPIPADAGTLKIFTFNEPQVLTSVSVLEIPTHFHMDLVYYICAAMAMKDSNQNVAKMYDDKWQQVLMNAKKWARLNKRADKFSNVQDEEHLIGGYLGLV